VSLYRQHIALIRSLAGGIAAFEKSLCDFPRRNGANFDETAFLNFLAGQHLGPWLKPFLCDDAAGRVFSRSLLDTLRERQNGNEAQTARLITQACEMHRGFSDRGIEALFFKGIISGVEIYGDPGRRQQRDVDVMVDRSDLRRAVAVLSDLGYDTQSDSSTGEDLESRIARMLEKPYLTRDSACSLERGRRKVDLHCTLRVRYEDSINFRTLTEDAEDVRIEGMILRGPSRESTLLIQLIMIADDLRRGACKAKLFLDLYVFCRTLGSDWSWEAFFAARRSQRLEKLAVNVCALVLDLWDCAGEFPELATGVDRRAKMLEIASSAAADEILSRPRGNLENKRLMKRIYRGGSAVAVARRIAKDLPHAAAHVAGLRRSRYRFTPPR
jgi:hypothetical protein